VRVELAASLAEADARRIGGDISGSRRLYLQVLSTATPSLDQASLFTTALASLPPGPIGDRLATSFQAWLDWALPLWLLDRPSLSPTTYRRLAGFSTLLEPSTVAIAELAAGEVERATALELRSDESWSEEWGLYYLAKTHALVALGRHKDAVQTLGKVHRNRRQGPVYHQLSLTLGLTEFGSSESRRPVVRRAWSSTDWVWHGAELSLVLEEPKTTVEGNPTPTQLEVHLDEIRPERAPIEVQWDGSHRGCWSVGKEAILSTEVSMSPGLHRLVLTAPTRGQIKPGTVRLRAIQGAPTEVGDPIVSKR
jgi:hypothetical protein